MLLPYARTPSYQVPIRSAIKDMGKVETLVRKMALILKYYIPMARNGLNEKVQTALRSRLEPLFNQIHFLESQETAAKDWYGEFANWLKGLPNSRWEHPGEAISRLEYMLSILNEWGDTERATNQKQRPDTSRAMDYIADMGNLVQRSRLAKGTIVYDKPAMTIYFMMGRGKINNMTDDYGHKPEVFYKGVVRYDRGIDGYEVNLIRIIDMPGTPVSKMQSSGKGLDGEQVTEALSRRYNDRNKPGVWQPAGNTANTWF